LLWSLGRVAGLVVMMSRDLSCAVVRSVWDYYRHMPVSSLCCCPFLFFSFLLPRIAGGEAESGKPACLQTRQEGERGWQPAKSQGCVVYIVPALEAPVPLHSLDLTCQASVRHDPGLPRLRAPLQVANERNPLTSCVWKLSMWWGILVALAQQGCRRLPS
jgi:hypothetical protein